MNLTFKRVVRNLISIFIIIGLVYYLWKHWHIFYSVLDASWHHILALVVCIFLTWVLNGCQLILFLRKLRVNVGFVENMLILIAMILGNYLPARMGSLIRMRYFKKVHGVNYTEFSGIIGARTIILFTSTGILGCIGMVGLKLSGRTFNLILFSIFLSMVFFSLGICLLPAPKVLKQSNPFLKLWLDFLTALDTIKSHPVLLCQVLALILLQFTVLAIRLQISFDAIQVDLSPWVFLILAPMTTLISFLSLTPGNLGLREWVIGIISFASGVDFHSGIFAGTLDRAILMAITFILGSGSLAYVWYRIENVISKGKDQSGLSVK